MKRTTSFNPQGTALILFLMFAALFAIGWIWNVVKIVQSDFAVITGMFIARCIGVFVAPLGAVLGYF